ncbi:MAG: lactate racemase domain-containing protein [Spirochaetes bacterium]|nr:lactate racemase domain-containing protein [Brevinematales bacterium]MCL1959780.1 lactate racemase domain-containing protein [Spirochaetota bacterium]
MEKTYASVGGCDIDLDGNEIQNIFAEALSNALCDINDSGQVIIIPPDITRIHSRAGFLTEIAAKRLGNRLGAILPALGTHTPMNSGELSRMFGNTPKEKFLVHDWRNDITELGRLNADFVEKITEGAVHYDWPVQVNKMLCRDNCGGNFSLVLSIGQVVPHEVAGMANHAKNIFVGTGGKEAIDKSHFAGAVYGMERIMGRTDTPVRALFDEGMRQYESRIPPVLWVLTVIGKERGFQAVRGLFIGFGRECFEKAAALSREINVNLLKKQVNKIVVYLNPDEYRTTWLGNKAIYRTRMAIKDGGELLILAPALERFGEDLMIDTLIRKYGYRSRGEITEKAAPGTELGENLCAAAHLIHGSSEGRFTVRYCAGEKLSRKDIESVGFQWGDLKEAKSRYDTNRLLQGWNTLPDGEGFFYVANPALGLWAEKGLFL